jgi:hypothetical protein
VVSQNFLKKIVARPRQLRYFHRSFERLFWGEQPPFTPSGRGGRYFFGVMESRDSAPPPRKILDWPLALVLAGLIVALLCGFFFWRAETWPARTEAQQLALLERAARDARDAFIHIAHLQPQVRVNNRVYFAQAASIAQLAVLERRTEVEHEMLHTWAGSTKRVKLRASFRVKAGFDLHQQFEVSVQPNEISMRLPHAVILGVEQEKLEVLAMENGYWNAISSADLEAELAALPELARAKEQEAGLPREAEQQLGKMLREQFHPSQPIRAIFGEPDRPRG